MNRQENQKTIYILLAILSVAVIWLALMVASCYEQNIKLFELLDRLTIAMNNPIQITFNEYSLKAILIFLFLYAMGIGVYFSSKENRRPGEEHGSARWGNVKSVVRRYMDKDSYKNIILSQNMRLGLNAKKHRRNLNVLIVGGSGAGKTRFYAKPNLMQCNTSFIVADPKGKAVVECITDSISTLSVINKRTEVRLCRRQRILIRLPLFTRDYQRTMTCRASQTVYQTKRNF